MQWSTYTHSIGIFYALEYKSFVFLRTAIHFPPSPLCSFSEKTKIALIAGVPVLPREPSGAIST